MPNYDVIILATDLSLGDSIRTVCPSCGGGSSRESSLTITKDMDGSVVWNCFRDKCTERGSSGYVRTSDQPVQKKVVKRFHGNTEPLSEYRLRQVQKRWGITDPPYWYWTPDYGGRIAMSVRSPKYIHRGWVLRDISGRARSKALTYMEPEEVALSWYKTSKDAPTVVVEDIPSAVRVMQNGVNAVSLLGTLVNSEKAIELSDYASRPIVIALDNDATAKSFHIARSYGLMWDNYQVLPLKKDFKDMSNEEIQHKLEEII